MKFHVQYMYMYNNMLLLLLLLFLLQELRLIFPNAQRLNRGNYVMSQLVQACTANDITDLIIIHEHRGDPGVYTYNTCTSYMYVYIRMEQPPGMLIFSVCLIIVCVFLFHLSLTRHPLPHPSPPRWSGGVPLALRPHCLLLPLQHCHEA